MLDTSTKLIVVVFEIYNKNEDSKSYTWRLKNLLNLSTLSGPKQLFYFLALETVFSWPFAYSIKAIVNRTNLVNRHLNWS